MEPEAAWRAVVTEIQKIPNVADMAIAAEEIFGGTSEKLAGIINLTNEEFKALEQSVSDTALIYSTEALEGARELDTAMQRTQGRSWKTWRRMRGEANSGAHECHNASLERMRVSKRLLG